MTPPIENADRRERAIAALLWYGTWLATALIAAGMILAALAPMPGVALSGHEVIQVGIAILILLPIGRVALMLGTFLRERDYVYALIATLVLAIIAIGVIVEA